LNLKKFGEYAEASKAARFLRARWKETPRVGIILGSGLGDAVHSVRQAKVVPYRSIPGFPETRVEGHAGKLHLGTWGKAPVAILEGRTHLYEGFPPEAVVFPTRVLALMGIEVLIVTCAAGGIARQAVPGSIMIFSDHLNLQGLNPLSERSAERWGPRFLDLTEAYDPRLRRAACAAARACRLRWFEGVYAALLGPSYETPAEICALRRLGADAVGMSTVPEVIAARQLGLRTLALAAITNRAAGLGGKPVSHEEVLDMGKRAAKDLGRLLEALLERKI